MKKMVLIKTNSTKIKRSEMKTFYYAEPTVGQRFLVTGFDGVMFSTSPVQHVTYTKGFIGMPSTITVTTRNSEYVFRVFGY